ncbi:MAG TPA: alpha/beta fold hydrolase [Flavobacterium sp.]|jgi:pimeloyl-ACP methyl ester carboxylesterase
MPAKHLKQRQSLQIPTIITAAAKVLEHISPKLLVHFAARLFTTPIKHQAPKRELEMDKKSIRSILHIPSIKKDIVVYHYGSSVRRVLLVHGWSGRATQLVKIADALLSVGFEVISFDAPAHGRSKGKTTLMPEFIACVLEIEKHFGPFEAAIGHSLGGMSLLNAAKGGLKVKSLVTIGSGNKVKDIFDEFVSQLKIHHRFSDLLRIHFESRYDATMESLSSYIAAKQIVIPALVIHDNDDIEVPVSASIAFSSGLKNGELLLTNNLGHRKILGDQAVIKKIISFVTKDRIYENDHDVVFGTVSIDGLSRTEKE